MDKAGCRVAKHATKNNFDNFYKKLMLRAQKQTFVSSDFSAE